MITLPQPNPFMFAVNLVARRSMRDFTDQELTLQHVSILLFAAQGRRHGEEKRLTPSAGARYPLEITLAARRIDQLAPSLYRYTRIVML
jgi:Nitroreductase family